MSTRSWGSCSLLGEQLHEGLRWLAGVHRRGGDFDAQFSAGGPHRFRWPKRAVGASPIADAVGFEREERLAWSLVENEFWPSGRAER